MNEWAEKKHTLKYGETHPTLNHRVFDTDRLVIYGIGDEHIGCKFYDADLHKKVLDNVIKDNAYIMHHGDIIETATKDSVGAGVYEQEDIIQEQLERVYHIYEPFKEKILTLLSGNHEQRVYNTSGINLTKIICKQLGIPFGGYGKLHYFKVGKQSYIWYSTHGASGSRLPHTKIKGCFDLVNITDAEIYSHAHVHELDYKSRAYYKVNIKDKMVYEAKKYFILTGHFLSYHGSYAHMKSMSPSGRGSPKIILYGDEKRVEVIL